MAKYSVKSRVENRVGQNYGQLLEQDLGSKAGSGFKVKGKIKLGLNSGSGLMVKIRISLCTAVKNHNP
jgi:hypothetical protein